ncbi:diaminopimelate epimerase [Paraburkholderia sp. EG286B]|uniref:diaminopimelate epimerase n=1 Tax=Paraburkholderia sp. EG286B TaxID=3237011 RepID=UPI0034D2E1D6
MTKDLFTLFHSQEDRRFIKVHGLGNDFVLVDGRTESFKPDRELIAGICDRHRGVGADQLLVVEQASSASADAFLRIYNVDGMEAQTCLNATRCAARLLLAESGAASVVVETLGGIIEASFKRHNQVSLKVPRPRWGWQEIPLSRANDGLQLPIESGPLKGPVAVNMGNPHLVCFVGDFDEVDIPLYAPALQRHVMVPEGANVGVAQLLSRERIKLAVWERPGILTQACGSGACAAALAARRLGLSESNYFALQMPGGELAVEVLSDETTLLTGPVAVSFTGRLRVS